MSFRPSGFDHLSQASVKYGHQLMWIVLARTLRGSLLIAGALMVLSNTGMWQFFSSSFAAHDIKRAAAWATGEPSTEVVMVAIDDAGFEQYFGGHSPLDKSRFMRLARTVDQAVPDAAAIVVDLDLSPAPDEPADALPGFFAGLKPGRWIVARPDSPARPPNPEWDQAMCQAGVRLAHPYVPTAFGYAQGTHQYAGSLSQVALHPDFDCAAFQAQPGRPRIAAPLSARYLQSGIVIPFEGDLDMLRLTLASLQPRYVVLGGTWGRTDVIGTPLGERFGLQLHAAGIDGALRGARLAPYAVQLIWAWLVLAMLSLAIGHGQRRLRAGVEPWTQRYPGHELLARQLWPLAVMALAFGGLLAASETAALLHARTGFWVPTSTVAAITLTALMFIWNWGRTQVTRHDSVGDTLWHAVLGPPLAELRSAVDHWRVWSGPAVPDSGRQRPGEPPPPLSLSLSRRRALAESVLSVLAFLMQTVMPVVSLYFVLTRQL